MSESDDSDFSDFPRQRRQINPQQNIQSSSNRESVQETNGGTRELISREWNFDQSFSSSQLAQNYIRNEKTWVLKREKCNNVYYVCKHYKKDNCPASIKLKYDANSFNVDLFRDKSDHHHSSSSVSTHMSDFQKETIKYIYNVMKIQKPRMINFELLQRNIPVVKNSTLSSFLTRMRKTQNPEISTFQQFENWCEKETQSTPSLADLDLDLPFLMAFEVRENNDDSNVRALFSTKRLLMAGIDSTLLCADATYKLNWNGFPTILAGTTDKDRKFHPFCIALCTTETAEDFEFVFRYLKLSIENIAKLNMSTYDSQENTEESSSRVNIENASVTFELSSQISQNEDLEVGNDSSFVECENLPLLFDFLDDCDNSDNNSQPQQPQSFDSLDDQQPSQQTSLINLVNIDFDPIVLLADSAPAITNGFELVFGKDNYIRVYCYPHVKRRVRDKLKALVKNKTTREDILDDFEFLHLARSYSTFIKAFSLFKKKWNRHPQLLKYIEKQWINKNCGWFEGHSQGYPSSNNALEATNNVIKNEHTLRQKLSIEIYMEKMKEIVKRWSVDRNEILSKQNVKSFQSVPTLSTKLWDSALEWELNTKIKVRKDEDILYYYSAPKDSPAISSKSIKIYENLQESLDWRTFDDYIDKEFRLTWKTTFDCASWETAVCTCPSFYKKYVCKHILGLAFRAGWLEPPREAVSRKLGKRRSPGRPKKCSRALERD